jgi:hypothetical protein
MLTTIQARAAFTLASALPLTDLALAVSVPLLA